ncbi:MAG: hypothetical protein ACTSW1_01855 [Candidatus Hodarchaeales archaeon]
MVVIKKDITELDEEVEREGTIKGVGEPVVEEEERIIMVKRKKVRERTIITKTKEMVSLGNALIGEEGREVDKMSTNKIAGMTVRTKDRVRRRVEIGGRKKKRVARTEVNTKPHLVKGRRARKIVKEET